MVNAITVEPEPDVCLYIEGNDLKYTSSQDIGGFQFEYNGCKWSIWW